MNKMKIITAFISLILLIVLAESGLRIAGFLYKKNIAAKYHQSGKINILCLGESTTFMGGNNSYPALLQKELNKKYPHKYHIINGGVPGVYTDYFANRIDEIINLYRPHKTILMLGINDNESYTPAETQNTFYKNLYLYSFFKKYQEFNSFIPKGNFYFTLPNYLKTQIPKGPNQVLIQTLQESLFQGDYQSFQKYFLENLNKFTPRETFVLANSYFIGTHDPSLLISGLHKLRANKNKVNIKLIDLLIMQSLLGSITPNQKEAFGYYKVLNSLSDTVKDQDTFINSVFFSEFEYLKTLHSWAFPTPPSYAQIVELLPNNLRDNFFPMTPERVHTLLRKSASKFKMKISKNPYALYTHEKTKDNIGKIIKRLKANDSQIILMQYPLRSVDKMKKLFKADYYIDNQENFLELLRLVPYEDLFIDRFAKDFGHTTKAGSMTIVEQIMRSTAFNNQ